MSKHKWLKQKLILARRGQVPQYNLRWRPYLDPHQVTDQQQLITEEKTPDTEQEAAVFSQ